MKSEIENRPSQIGFTLVELLVVVAIIGVLLSLLTPAMDKAIYQAELTVCATHLKAIVTGVTAYAINCKRLYPDRPNQRIGSGRADLLYQGNARQQWDDRALLRGYIAINATLNDPLTAQVDLEHPAVRGPSDLLQVLAPYDLWFSWRFKVSEGGKGMFRVGDRFEYLDDRFNILASDQDLVAGSLVLVTSNHPDDAGLMAEEVVRDELYSTGNAFTFSRWRYNAIERGKLDRNFGYGDGSVVRLNEVTLGDDVTPDDDRITRVPLFSGDSQPTWRVQLPISR